MAGRGPAPKPDGQVRRRNSRPETVSVSTDGEVRGPELPEGPTWPVRTVAWWKTWRSSALAQTFTDTDWDFLLDTALLHAAFWSGDASVASELRLRVAKFGATPEDRARLKLTVTETGEKLTAPVKPAAPARKQRLLKVIDGSG